MKRCPKCGETKPFTEFHRRLRNRDGYAENCKACKSERMKARYASPERREFVRRYGVAYRRRPDVQARLKAYRAEYKKRPGAKRAADERTLQATFGITLADFDRMVSEQNGRCAICGDALAQQKRRPHVDHCHRTGKVRSILCHGCNTGLGLFRESPERLTRAAEYARKWGLSHPK